MKHTQVLRIYIFLFTLSVFSISDSKAQSSKKQELKKLDYMIGEWVGVSKSFKNDSVNEVPAYESIQYMLDSNIIEINLKSETLVLHTIITYSEQDSTFYYHPFSKSGSGKYKALFDGERLIVTPHKTVRYIFTATPDGHFQEYGERLTDGTWIRYFEDTFKKMD